MPIFTSFPAWYLSVRLSCARSRNRVGQLRSSSITWANYNGKVRGASSTIFADMLSKSQYVLKAAQHVELPFDYVHKTTHESIISTQHQLHVQKCLKCVSWTLNIALDSVSAIFVKTSPKIRLFQIITATGNRELFVTYDVWHMTYDIWRMTGTKFWPHFFWRLF